MEVGKIYKWTKGTKVLIIQIVSISDKHITALCIESEYDNAPQATIKSFPKKNGWELIDMTQDLFKEINYKLSILETKYK